MTPWPSVVAYVSSLGVPRNAQPVLQQKANKQWIWIAMDAKTRQGIAFPVGDRSRRSARRLSAKIPHAYRQHATFYTDQYVVYEGVIPAT
jgi:insertion element IS1 protein InsB